MGLNSENAARLIFDIETAPLPEAADYIEAAEAPANYKDPLKIADYIAAKNAEAVDRCGLDCDLCRIVAIGWADEREWPAARTMTIEQFRGDEALMLKSFWLLAADRHLVGFNCLGFDLPVLLRRSLYLGVPTPHLQIDRFKHPQVTDLMDELSFGGKLKFRGLAFYCKRFGIDIPDSLTGAGIAQAVAEGRWSDIEGHVRADVEKTALLAQKLGHFSRELAAVL